MAYSDKKAAIKWQGLDKTPTKKVRVNNSHSSIYVDEYERLWKSAEDSARRSQEQFEARELAREFELRRIREEYERKIQAAYDARQRKIEEADRQLANSDIQDLGLF